VQESFRRSSLARGPSPQKPGPSAASLPGILALLAAFLRSRAHKPRQADLPLGDPLPTPRWLPAWGLADGHSSVARVLASTFCGSALPASVRCKRGASAARENPAAFLQTGGPSLAVCARQAPAPSDRGAKERPSKPTSRQARKATTRRRGRANRRAMDSFARTAGASLRAVAKCPEVARIRLSIPVPPWPCGQPSTDVDSLRRATAHRPEEAGPRRTSSRCSRIGPTPRVGCKRPIRKQVFKKNPSNMRADVKRRFPRDEAF